MVIMTLVLWAMVGIGTLYSVAPFTDAVDSWGSWRKCLLLPLAAAVFEDPEWKKKFLNVFIGLMVIGAVISFISYGFSIKLISHDFIGTVVGNHATQAIFFSAAIFSCLILILFTQKPRTRMLLAAAAVITANLILVTPGRSGYLTFIVFIMLVACWSTKKTIRMLAMPLVPVGIVLLLFMSPTSKNIIKLGVDEIGAYKTAPEYSSMGARMVFWENTLSILKKMEHPFIGYGTEGFKIPYAAQVDGQKGWQAVVSSDPHNQYLKILVEHGAIGLIVFLVFLASFFRQSVPRPFYYLGVGLLLAWSTTGLFNGHFGTFHEGRLFFLWCGVMLTNQNANLPGSGPDISPDRKNPNPGTCPGRSV